MDNLSWPDILALAIIAWSAYSATRRGFVAVLMSLLGFALSLIVAFALFSPLSVWLSAQFEWSPVWSTPVAFVSIWLVSSLVFNIIERTILHKFGYGLQENAGNRALAVLPGALQGAISAAVLLTLMALLPLQSNVRTDVLRSPIAGRLVSATLALERPFEGVFGPAAREALGFLTVKPPTGGDTPTEHAEYVELQFTVDNPEVSLNDEAGMLELVNQERTSRGLQPLVMDTELLVVARDHARDMFKRGYFAHETPEGIDPFQRMDAAEITYLTAGENLALAPSLDIAHEGLMNSPGHRANILNSQFGRVGIGVLDGGVYGKMFVQEFRD
jgi:uncharacterized protein YkwD/uncharacterized membrane protein required for colicin V production